MTRSESECDIHKTTRHPISSTFCQQDSGLNLEETWIRVEKSTCWSLSSALHIQGAEKLGDDVSPYKEREISSSRCCFTRGQKLITSILWVLWPIFWRIGRRISGSKAGPGEVEKKFGNADLFPIWLLSTPQISWKHIEQNRMSCILLCSHLYGLSRA